MNENSKTNLFDLYYAKGAAWAKRNGPLPADYVSSLEKEINKLPAQLKDAFLDGIESVTWARPIPPNVLY